MWWVNEGGGTRRADVMCPIKLDKGLKQITGEITALLDYICLYNHSQKAQMTASVLGSKSLLKSASSLEI